MADERTATPDAGPAPDAGLAPDATSEAELGGNPLLSVEGLTVTFGGVRAVQDVHFSVPRGTIVGLIGPNGAGKSTALKAIGGEVHPNAGRICFDGVDTVGSPAHATARRGLIRTFQLGGEFARLTVMENLLVAVPRQPGATFLGALRGRRYWKAAQEREVVRAREILAALDLAGKENEYASDLSGGQRKLVEIARALMARPKMLLLDEPMAGVNRSLARRIEKTLAQLREDGLSMLLVEHELGLVERLCDRVVVMANGERIAEGAMSEVRSRGEVLGAYLGGVR